VHHGRNTVSHEHRVVSLANASPEPGAVMVMNSHTHVAVLTVEHPWSLYDIARWALIKVDFFFVLQLIFSSGHRLEVLRGCMGWSDA